MVNLFDKLTGDIIISLCETEKRQSSTRQQSIKITSAPRYHQPTPDIALLNFFYIVQARSFQL